MSKIFNDTFRAAFIHPRDGKGIFYELTDKPSLDKTTAQADAANNAPPVQKNQHNCLSKGKLK